MSDPLDLDAIEQRANAATPGPWAAELSDEVNLWGEAWMGPVIVQNDKLVADLHRRENPPDEPEDDADAAFIAHARTDIPALVARVWELEAIRISENAELGERVAVQARNVAMYEARFADIYERLGVASPKYDDIHARLHDLLAMEGIARSMEAERDELRATLATHLGAVLGEVATERRKQIRKWGAEHDDEHLFGVIRIAAAELAVDGTDARVDNPDGADAWGLVAKYGHEGTEPDRRRALIIAAALIVAEIERKDREAMRAADLARGAT